MKNTENEPDSASSRPGRKVPNLTLISQDRLGGTNMCPEQGPLLGLQKGQRTDSSSRTVQAGR